MTLVLYWVIKYTATPLIRAGVRLRIEGRENVPDKGPVSYLEVGLRSKCTAAVSKGGSLTLPAKKLYEIIKAG